MSPSQHDESDFDGPWWRHPVLRNALIAGLIAGAGFVLGHLGLIPKLVENLCYWIAIPLGGYHWAREGVEKLFRKREVGIEILMLAAMIASAILGMWDEAAALVVLYGTAEGVEEYTYSRTRHSIRALSNLAPKEARVLRNGRETTVPAEILAPGDVFTVRPGELIPTDGIVKSGRSSIDESPITGESVPADKGVGDKVFAASINRNGALVVEVTTSFLDNTLSKIIHLVEEAQEQKGNAQKWIDRFGRLYSPAVLVASILLAAIPWMLGWDSAYWVMRSVVLLVAAAPCALIMSMPVATAAGIGAAGKHGILIKGGVHLEHLGSIKVVALDKTGTLTRGKLKVTDVIQTEENETNLLTLAAGLENFSEHPLGRAILEEAKARGLILPTVEHFESLPGAGVTGVVSGQKMYLGNPDLFSRLRVEMGDSAPLVRKLQDEGKTVVLVGTSEKILGFIALRDELRKGVPQIIAKLHATGIRTAMLTGDNHRTALALARQAGINDVRADLKPEHKAAAIQLLEKQYGCVLMVGDGVNDAPALATSTCGMAMGAAGMDAAIEAADIALMADDLEKILEAVALGKKVRRVSSQNIVFSILVLATLIPLALTGMVGVAVAVLAHETSELITVLNGLRAARP